MPNSPNPDPDTGRDPDNGTSEDTAGDVEDTTAEALRELAGILDEDNARRARERSEQWREQFDAEMMSAVPEDANTDTDTHADVDRLEARVAALEATIEQLTERIKTLEASLYGINRDRDRNRPSER